MTLRLNSMMYGLFLNILGKLNILRMREIADLVGLDRSVISRMVQNSNFTKMHHDYQNGKSVEEIAKWYGHDLVVTLLSKIQILVKLVLRT